MSKIYEYWDVKIYNPKKGRIYYLRNKRNRRNNEITMTIRTHKNGKGTAVTKPISTVILSASTFFELWKKIDKKFHFQFVSLTNVEDMPI